MDTTSQATVLATGFLHTIRREILGGEVTQAQMSERYAEYFAQFIKKGVQAELLDEKLMQYDLAKLGAALKADRDLQFDYLGLQTLYDRYFLHHDGRRFELPQAFFMRVAMGLALNERDRETRDRGTDGPDQLRRSLHHTVGGSEPLDGDETRHERVDGRQEDRVDSLSKTETFVAMKLEIEPMLTILPGRARNIGSIACVTASWGMNGCATSPTTSCRACCGARSRRPSARCC